ncbi:ATP-dependent DNA helicase [Fictibacillus iocasae]|uniref:ATP-dependent DNA helicase n=1 Tax=Fictibacillus iocasae TaxID=2715437 RepID=A0ABW2NRP5_9BACL
MSEGVKISVRSLVEYMYRSGSITSGFMSSASLTDGTKAHQKIQKTYGKNDEREVYLKCEVVQGGITFYIDGRADGLLYDDAGAVTVDEIKSTARDLGVVEEDSHPVHWAQAKCYAYMYSLDHELCDMNVQLTYVHVVSEEKKRFVRTFSFAELETAVFAAAAAFVPYARMLAEHEAKRNESIRELPFPFDRYRNGQRKLAGAVYKSIADGRTLFANAPTGTGKTISTTFPAVKAIGEGHLQRFFYLTAKTITRTAAEEAFHHMQSRGLHLHTVTITAKDKACLKEETRCQPDYCEFADGHFDRINGAMLDILSNETVMTREVIQRYSLKHRVCPFEFSIDLAYASDAVICDYNYVFDPKVSLKRLFEEQKKKTAILVDEAHNLVDRARSMFSAEVEKSLFLQLKREFKGRDKGVLETVSAVNDYLLSVRKSMEPERERVEAELPEELVSLLEAFCVQSERVLASGSDSELLLQAYFAANSFNRISSLYDERFVTMTESYGSEVRVKLYCLDPSHVVSETGKRYRSRVYFSATLSPLGYFREMLGSAPDDYVFKISSPFPKENWDVYVQPLSTRYRDRERSYEPIARALAEVLTGRPGNFLVFFPSYAYMNEVYEAFSARDEAAETMVQQPGMSEDERESFLRAFRADQDGTFIGFAVMGGIFSEGVDLKGDRLNGVAVVGVGLPQLGLERNIIREYFNRSGRNGYDYAYVYPGMNKVLQAGGRLIRSEEDTGVILLIDDRYITPQYRALLPDEWRNFTILNR